jgi:hypothetical protein
MGRAPTRSACAPMARAEGLHCSDQLGKAHRLVVSSGNFCEGAASFGLAVLWASGTIPTQHFQAWKTLTRCKSCIRTSANSAQTIHKARGRAAEVWSTPFKSAGSNALIARCPSGTPRALRARRSDPRASLGIAMGCTRLRLRDANGRERALVRTKSVANPVE